MKEGLLLKPIFEIIDLVKRRNARWIPRRTWIVACVELCADRVIIKVPVPEDDASASVLLDHHDEGEPSAKCAKSGLLLLPDTDPE